MSNEELLRLYLAYWPSHNKVTYVTIEMTVVLKYTNSTLIAGFSFIFLRNLNPLSFKCSWCF